jgi:hypothetical protein
MKISINKSTLYSLVVLGLLLSHYGLFAQSKIGTTVGQFLKIEPSSRAVAMGNAGVSLNGDAAYIYYNPASIGRISGTDVQFTFNKWLADIQYSYTTAAINFEKIGTFSLQVTTLNSGEIDVRTVEQPLGTGEKYTVANFALGVGYAIMLTNKVSVGLQLAYVTERIWHSSLNAFALNFGVQYQLTEDGAILGASVSNFGTKASYSGRDLFIDHDFDPEIYGDNDKLPANLRTDQYSLPTMFRAGISYPLNFNDNFGLLVAIDAVHPNDNNESINIGGELRIHDNFRLRGGYRNLFLKSSEGGLVLGGGVLTKFVGGFSIRFDYAWADYGRLAEAHRITLSLGF